MGKTTKTNQNAGNLPTMAIRHTTFEHRIFSIHAISFHKASSFSKMVSLSTTWFSRFTESISEPIEIRTGKLGKTILVTEINPSVLLPKTTISCTELRIAHGQSCWKEDNACFPKTPRSTRSMHSKTFKFQPKKG